MPAATTDSKREGFVRWGGVALILWASHLLVRDFTWAFTHGTTEDYEGLRFLGLSSGQYALVWPAFAPLGLIGLAAVFVRVSPRLGAIGSAGFVIALVGLALYLVASVMQNWMGADFYSSMVLGGWLLSILSVFVLALGLVLAGIDILRANALPRGRLVVLMAGILLVPTLLLTGYIVGNSENTLPWQLLYGGISVPYDLCWLWLGVLLLARTPRTTDGSPAIG
jgi:uncharacterized membrane protein (DUF485 family)